MNKFGRTCLSLAACMAISQPLSAQASFLAPHFPTTEDVLELHEKESETVGEQDESEAISEGVFESEALTEVGTETVEDTFAENESEALTESFTEEESEANVPASQPLPDEVLMLSITHTAQTNIEGLKASLEQRIQGWDGAWSIYMKDLSNDESFIINDTAMNSASCMKLFVLGTVVDAIDKGELEETGEILAHMESMISVSSNENTNALLYILGDGILADGIGKVNSFIQSHGYSSMTHEYNGFQDTSTILDSSHTNQISAKDAGLLLESIYHRTLSSRKVCNRIEGWLLNQATRYKIPAGVDASALSDGSVQIGNKTGETDNTENDTALVFTPEGDYVLCVMSHDWNSKNQAQSRISLISGDVYRYFTQESTGGVQYLQLTSVLLKLQGGISPLNDSHT